MSDTKTPINDTPELASFDCDVCNQRHDTLPLSVAFALPDFVNKLLPWDRESRVKMSEDWCIVDDKFFYLRGCLSIPIANSRNIFTWGVWVTISEFDFDSTMELWNDPARTEEPLYSGTIANTMPSYDETRNLAIQIQTMAVGERPRIIIDEAAAPHKLFEHQSNGMPKERVIELAKFILHGGENNPYGYLCEK